MRNWWNRFSFSRRHRRRKACSFDSLRIVPRLQRLEDRTTPTVNLSGAFQGMNFNDPGNQGIPPDTNAAVGPTSVLETVNTSLKLFDRAGNTITSMTGDTFFGITNGNAIVTDPFVIFDEYAQRFVVYFIDIDMGAQTALFHIAVSNNAAPTNFTTDWTEKQTIDESAVIGGTKTWGDYPRFGYNADAWVITLNQFAFGGGFQGLQVISFNKQTYLDQNPATHQEFKVLPNLPLFTMTPAQMHGATPGSPMFFVSSDTGASNVMHVVRMTNVLSANPAFAETPVSVTPYDTPGTTPQPGNAGDIGSGGLRVSSVDWRGNRLVATHTVDGGGVPSVSWLEFNTGGVSPTLTQEGRIHPGAGIGTWWGGITISPQGALGITYIQASATEFMSMYVTGQNPGEAPGTVEAPVKAVPGLATYNAFDGAPFRTGDFSTVAIDPVDGSFWAANEIAASDGNWGTGIAHFDTGLIGGGGGGGTPGPIWFTPDPTAEGAGSVLFGMFTDPNGQLLSHPVRIVWGDGSADTTFMLQPGIFKFTLSHVFFGIGSFETDANVGTSSGVIKESTNIIVHNVPPSVTIGGVPTTPSPEGRTISFTANVVDPGSSLETFAFTWIIKKNGVVFATGNQSVFTVTPDDNASWQVLLTVSDGNGGIGVAPARNFTTFNVPPTAVLINNGPKPAGVPITVAFTQQHDAAADILAGFLYSFDFNNNGSFTDPGDVLNSTTPSATHVFAANGLYIVHGRIMDKDGGFSDYTTRVFVANGGNGGNITTRYIATGTGPGGGPLVNVYNMNGTLKFSFFAYPKNFTGGVRVATGDVNGDGVEDIITAPGPGSVADIKVFDGATGGLIREFLAYSPAFLGGAYVAAGDVNGDGFADIITGAGAGGGPDVRVFDGQTGPLIQEFFAYTAAFAGGVTVAAGDVNGDGFADIITGAGPGGGPHVEAFDGHTGALIRSFMGADPTFTGGVFVAAGDINGDGFSDIIVSQGSQPGVESRVRTFNGLNLALMNSFVPFPSYTGGVRVAADDIDGDGKADLIIGSGAGVGSHVMGLRGFNLTSLLNFSPYDPSFLGGVFVG
jgi:hypothetical protein